MRILNFGSLNYDYVYSLPHIVTLGETIASTKMEIFCGGKGLNQSIALAKAGANVYHAGMVGEDGQELCSVLAENGVDIQHVKQIDGKSGHAIIQVEESGQNSIVLFGGSNRRITKDYIDAILSQFEKGDYLLLQNEVNLVDYLIEQAYEKGLKIILNPSPYDQQLEKCDFNKIDTFLLNEVEGYQVTGKTEPEEILNEMLKKYPKASVVLTLGDKGARYGQSEKRYRQSSFKVDVVDTTAAGDTFTGFYLAEIMRGHEVQEALELAAKASAIAVGRAGAANSIPKLEELEA
ncbi:ribokinase [Cellulosilyticum ruminicola]|uniref:ribokinase n=1 Tax=Cellulosilyticum ruminicola TaxID=425254 RepID=UPI0006D26583|nr:ribokinase [Cellulosilyticum ruminicola]